MKRTTLYSLSMISVLLWACSFPDTDPLPSWNNTSTKTKIINFIHNEVPKIPIEDRLAVFDMDGTISCEQPLWFEMYFAVQGLCRQSQKDSSLLEQKIYQYANKLNINPKDSSVINHWGPYIDSMIYAAYVGWDNEDYIAFNKRTIDSLRQPDYKVKLSQTFYPPMLELIEYLKSKQFQVYIVSGSLQGVLWSSCPKAIGFDRAHLIGTRQKMSPQYIPLEKTKFILEQEHWLPKNNRDGKALNIYSYIGKTPIFAFGNTTGDFGMFHLTSSNKLPNISFLLNHNDAEREYVYDPWHGKGMPAWRDTMASNGWNIVNMKENFKAVFPEK